MYQGVLFAGFGGQGVISAGILLAYAGMLEGKKVTFFPSYGAEMRGGTANCSVVISSDEIASPVVSMPDSLIVMNEPSLLKFEETVVKNGLMLLNTSLVSSKPKRSDIEVIEVPANEIASKIGSLKSANMVMVGAFCKKTGALDIKSVCEAFPKVYTKLKEDLIKTNLEAIQKGADL